MIPLRSLLLSASATRVTIWRIDRDNGVGSLVFAALGPYQPVCLNSTSRRISSFSTRSSIDFVIIGQS